jgi:hypothetical protein
MEPLIRRRAQRLRSAAVFGAIDRLSRLKDRGERVSRSFVKNLSQDSSQARQKHALSLNTAVYPAGL